MKKVLLACTILCISIAGCDSADQNVGSVTPPSENPGTGLAPTSTSSVPMMRFATREAFLSAIETAKLPFTSPGTASRSALRAPEGFTSLYSAQRTDAVENQALPILNVSSLPDIPDPALASVLNSDGDVEIGDLRYRFTDQEAVAFTENGTVAARHPVAASVATALNRSAEYYPASDCDQFGPIKVYNRPLYQVCGETWNRAYFLLYASQGTRTDHYRQEKGTFRGWHYADARAHEISLYCTQTTSGQVLVNLRYYNADTLTKYFDSGFLGTGDDTTVGSSTCQHYSKSVNPSTNQFVDGFTMTQRSY